MLISGKGRWHLSTIIKAVSTLQILWGCFHTSTGNLETMFRTSIPSLEIELGGRVLALITLQAQGASLSWGWQEYRGWFTLLHRKSEDICKHTVAIFKVFINLHYGMKYSYWCWIKLLNQPQNLLQQIAHSSVSYKVWTLCKTSMQG